MDCSAATQNMLIAAESLNIGSCWVELVSLAFMGPQAKELRDKLNLPEGYTPLHCVLLGYKDMEGKTAPRKENAVQYIR
ncbi:MAG: nitroreductase family protein [Intestinibacter sp.]